MDIPASPLKISQDTGGFGERGFAIVIAPRKEEMVVPVELQLPGGPIRAKRGFDVVVPAARTPESIDERRTRDRFGHRMPV